MRVFLTQVVCAVQVQCCDDVMLAVGLGSLLHAHARAGGAGRSKCILLRGDVLLKMKHC